MLLSRAQRPGRWRPEARSRIAPPVEAPHAFIVTETSEAPDLPERRRDEPSVLLERQDSLDSVKSELAAKRRKRNLIRVLLGGISGARMVAELDGGR